MPQVEDFAFIELEDGRMALGRGPFAAQTRPPEDAPAFYVNRFALDDPCPWKVPSRLEVVDRLPDDLPGVPAPAIDWTEPGDTEFRRVFGEIEAEISAGRALKLVPVVTQRGTLSQGSPMGLAGPAAEAAEGLWSYAWSCGEHGFAGATPERFIRVEGREVVTMALAGTAVAGSEQRFAGDPKEIREHELVASFLAERLGQFGRTIRGDRGLLQLGDITHFMTPLRLLLEGDPEPDIAALVAALHPTPAVGHLPHDATLLSRLQMIRAELGCPAYFGAPLGLWKDGVFHSVVAIRGLFWDEGGVSLPSGCGIIEQSRFEAEWAELQLKRRAVRNFFGLQG